MPSLQMTPRPNHEIDSTKTAGVPIWQDPAANCQYITYWTYDPWCSNASAFVQHGHHHTGWAPNIHYNYMDWQSGKSTAFTKPAVFDWKDKPVFIVGAGPSLAESVPMLNNRPDDAITIFLNQSFGGVDRRENDYTLIIDDRILAKADQELNKRPLFIMDTEVTLLTAPMLSPEIVSFGWKAIHGLTFWTQSPLNNWMRDLFPHLPPLSDQLSCSHPAVHLAAKSGANQIIFVGADHCLRDDYPHDMIRDIIEVKGIGDNDCVSNKTYAMSSNSLGRLAMFANQHFNTEIINASGRGILGYDARTGEVLPWFQFKDLKNVMDELNRNGSKNNC